MKSREIVEKLISISMNPMFDSPELNGICETKEINGKFCTTVEINAEGLGSVIYKEQNAETPEESEERAFKEVLGFFVKGGIERLKQKPFIHA